MAAARRPGLHATDPALVLVEAARDGDAEARAELFDRYHGALYRYAIARLGTSHDAEDVVAETFLAAFRTLPGFRWRGVPVDAWLFRIAASKVVDVVRRRQRSLVPIDAMPVEPIDDTADPAKRIEGTERQAELADALDRLPDTQRDVLVMRFFLGRSVADVARSLGRSDGAVKQLQARALANLRRELEP